MRKCLAKNGFLLPQKVTHTIELANDEYDGYRSE